MVAGSRTAPPSTSRSAADRAPAVERFKPAVRPATRIRLRYLAHPQEEGSQEENWIRDFHHARVVHICRILAPEVRASQEEVTEDRHGIAQVHEAVEVRVAPQEVQVRPQDVDHTFTNLLCQPELLLEPGV